MKRFSLGFSLALATMLWLCASPLLASTNFKAGYGTQGVSITVTLTSLANAGARQSVCVDNTSNAYFDAQLFLTVKTGASSTSATGYVAIYVGGSIDGGTTWTENATSSTGCTTDAGITLTVPPNMAKLPNCNTVANATTYYCGPYNLSAAFGGQIPQKWFVVIQNNSGGTLDGTAGGTLTYQGLYATGS